MGTTMNVAVQIAKVPLALFGCILMPLLIWVALGIAIKQKAVQKEVLKEQVLLSG